MAYDVISFKAEALENYLYATREEDYLTANHRDLKVNVFINDTVVNWNGHTDPYSLVVFNLDHRPRYSWHWGKKAGKVMTEYKCSVFEPFTCSCGVGGCAGIYDGIYVRKRKHSVEWRGSKKDGYDFLGKSFFSFDRQAYEKAFKDLLLQIEHLCYKEFWLVVDPGHCEEQLVLGLDFLKLVKENKID